jgi:hypothetical protein
VRHCTICGASLEGRAAALVFDAIDDPSLLDRFQDGSYFVASDHPHFDALVREGRELGHPVVVLFPGRQYLIVNAARRRLTPWRASCTSFPDRRSGFYSQFA